MAPLASSVYPLEVSFSVGFNADYESTVASVSNTRLQRSAISCGDNSPSIVVSYVTQWKNLGAALVSNPTPCANYYVLVPAAGMSPRGGSAASILKLNQRKRVAKAQATFIPVATFNYYSIPSNASDGQYEAVGSAFAALLASRDYNLWGIDEAPADLVQKKTGNSSWQDFVALVGGLSSTGDRGVVEDAVEAQSTGTDLKALKQYKRSVKGLLDEESGQPQFDWQTVANHVTLWAQETYTYCGLVCANGASLSPMATHANQYMQHFGRLAFAPDAPSTVGAARGALGISYLPLTNDWKGGDNLAYQTGSLDLAQMKALASLQIYANRAWAGNSYSGSRIGLRWTDNTVDFSTSERAALAARIASSLEGAYSPGGTPIGACDPTGAGITANCIPSGVGGSFTPNWSIFRLWGARGTSGVSCDFSGDTPGSGLGPPNDDFSDAQVMTGDNGSVQGTLVGASGQVGEPGAPTRSVWYCWTPSSAAINTGCYEPSTASFQIWTVYNGGLYTPAPQLNVYTGSDFSSLQEIASSDPDSGALVFPAVAGVTYALQVTDPGDLPDPALFQLAWPIGCF